MPIYYPIDAEVPFAASLSDLIAFQWSAYGISAEFALPGDTLRMLRVSFDRQCIVRLLDEMPLSTEDDDGPSAGLVPDHFAYRVAGGSPELSPAPGWM